MRAIGPERRLRIAVDPASGQKRTERETTENPDQNCHLPLLRVHIQILLAQRRISRQRAIWARTCTGDVPP